MSLSYQTRTRIKRVLTAIAVLLTVAAIVWVCWLFWLDRFVRYDRDLGVQLDFTLSGFAQGTPVKDTPQRKPVQIVYLDQEDSTDIPQPARPISGYHIAVDDLKKDIPGVRAKLEALPEGTAILLDVKNATGYFHYSTMVGEKRTDTIDIDAFDQLLDYLTSSKFYVIARLPAFRDRYFGLNNIPSGLSYQGGGGALWLDKGGCYWLNPTKEKPLSYLISIAKELKNRGVDEVVFTDFCFPEADNLVFSGDREEAISNAAATLVAACATENFWVSFTGNNDFPLPQGNSRLYLDNIAAADLQATAEKIPTDDPAVHILFYATGHDTRYDEYSVLRPLDLAQ